MQRGKEEEEEENDYNINVKSHSLLMSSFWQKYLSSSERRKEEKNQEENKNKEEESKDDDNEQQLDTIFIKTRSSSSSLEIEKNVLKTLDECGLIKICDKYDYLRMWHSEIFTLFDLRDGYSFEVTNIVKEDKKLRKNKYKKIDKHTATDLTYYEIFCIFISKIKANFQI